jgi:FixJ family two-component response regulator
MTSKQTDAQAIVFVVDDDASMRMSLSNLIESMGLRVQAFASAPDFLAMKLPAAPCCLILDVRLPGLSGLDFQAKLASAKIDIPVTATSR